MRMRLPIEAIGNWLNRTNANGQKDNERFLSLKIHDDVPNLREMFEFLKEVYLFFVKLLQQYLFYFCVQKGLDSLNIPPRPIYITRTYREWQALPHRYSI